MVFSILSIVPAYAVQVGSINQFNINGASSDKNLGNNNTTDNSTTNQTASTETKSNNTKQYFKKLIIFKCYLLFL